MLYLKKSGGLITLIALVTIIGCSSDTATDTTIGEFSNEYGQVTLETTWPTALPADFTQPWDELDENGKVAASITAASEFIPGVETFDASAGTVEAGEALSLASGDAGSGTLNWAQYRMLMGGNEPGVVAVDANLLRMSDDAVSSFFVGLSNSGKGGWEWHGPFTDSHVRISTGAAVRAGASYLSSLGNLFVCVVAHDGAVFDVVGVGSNPYSAGDLVWPDTPALNTVTPVAGGLMLEWLHPGVADLAGFKVYYATTFFTDGDTPGVRAINYITGGNRQVLTDIDALTYVRVTAVDFSGNESEPSNLMSAAPLPGDPLDLALTTDLASGLIGEGMNLTATGADSYDWDLDGDGVYEITGVSTGTQALTPGSVGIIRPAVRGASGGGDNVACAAVSLLISSNARPIAQGFAAPAFGEAPLAVTFTGLTSDFDGTVVKWAWDFDGDKSYDYVTEDIGAANPPPEVFVAPGFYNAKFRAWDDDGAWDVDTVGVDVYPAAGSGNQSPVAALSASPPECSVGQSVVFNAGESFDPDGTIVLYDWDTDNDGVFDTTTGTEHWLQVNMNNPDSFEMTVRVTDNEGATATASIPFVVHGWVTLTLDSTGDVGIFTSLAVVDGSPAISYRDNSNQNLKYARATTSTGASAFDWTQIITVDSTGNVGEYSSLAVVDGSPAISYYDNTNNSLKYARATTSTGGSAPDWSQTATVDDSAAVGYHTSLAVVDGNPAISYQDVTTHDLKYARASTSTGSLAADWTQIVTVDTLVAVGSFTSLAVVDGNPAISYRDTTNSALKYARAETSTGGGVLDWTQIIAVDNSADDGMFSSLAVVDGCPAICYYDNSTYDLRYARAKTSTGGVAADWSQLVTADSFGNVGENCSMAVIDGRPAIAYRDGADDDLKFAHAGHTGSKSSDWTQAMLVDTDGNTGSQTSLAAVDGHPAISYYNSTDGDLKYAIYF